jgi:endonuclease IV
VHDKTKVGVCLDTAHAFASGFDIRTKEGFESMMSDFDRCIGVQYLKVRRDAESS